MRIKPPDEPPDDNALSSQTPAPPIIVLFSRDEIVVVALPQLRRAGYDVRYGSTPVELFDILGRERVALVILDVTHASVGRREFWVALDAVRRGRPYQVLTFRHIGPGFRLDHVDQKATVGLADVEIYGTHDAQRLVAAVQRRLQSDGAPPHTTGSEPTVFAPRAWDQGEAHHWPRGDIPGNALPANVFLSYSRQDAEIARRVVKALQAIGITVWLDHDRLTPGTLGWEREIRRAFTSSAGVIYVASEAAAASMYVRDELAIARDNQIRVYPLWARGSIWSSCAPLGWGQAQYADGRGEKLASALHAIATQVAKDCGGV